VRKSLLVERYVNALGESVKEPAELRRIMEVLARLSDFYMYTPVFRYALGNPAHSVKKRAQILDIALDAHGAPQPLRNFMHALLERNRMALLPGIAAQFGHSIDNWLNTVEVTVVTVVPLPKDLHHRLVKALERLAGKTVRLRSQVDPSIVGGLVVYMWGVYFDFSLRTRLERLKQELLSEEQTQYGY